MFEIGNGTLVLTLCEPGEYYKGTRFDRAGVFRRIVYKGLAWADVWFDDDNPFRHDHLCGTSEEFFSQIGYESAPVGGTFLKVGVGLLVRPSEDPYDWFHTYEIADEGRRTLFHDASKAVFTQILDGYYEYEKTVEITGQGSWRIAHKLRNTGERKMELEQYNHNFFTFGIPRVGPERSVEFGFPIEGQWRSDSVNADKDVNVIRITSPMLPGQKAYIGNVLPASDYEGGYSFVIRAGGRSVHVSSDCKMSHAVFWTNHRVFCPEPYIPIQVESGETACWLIDYVLE